MRLLFILLLASMFSRGQAPGIPKANECDCHVYAVDLLAAEELVSRVDAGEDIKDEKLLALAKKGELTLGEFKAEIVEERPTTKAFPLPFTNQVVTATVMYTDETMGFAESFWQGLFIGSHPVEAALVEPGAAITEVNFNMYTYKVRTKQRLLIDGRPWVVGLECQLMSDNEWKDRLRKAAARGNDK